MFNILVRVCPVSSHFVHRRKYLFTNSARSWVWIVNIFHVSSYLCCVFEANWTLSSTRRNTWTFTIDIFSLSSFIQTVKLARYTVHFYVHKLCEPSFCSKKKIFFHKQCKGWDLDCECLPCAAST